MTNKEKAVAIITQGVSQGDKQVIMNYVKEDYIQHNPVVPDGRAGVLRLIEKIAQGELPAPAIRVERVMEDSDFVVVHSAVQWPNRKVMFEIFRFEEGDRSMISIDSRLGKKGEQKLFKRHIYKFVAWIPQLPSFYTLLFQLFLS